jgi:hypothetical protein
VKTFAIALVTFVALSAAAQQADSQAEQQIFKLLNLARAREGLTSLKLDPKLQDAARQHSRLMAEKNQLSHQIGDEPAFTRRMVDAGAQFSTAGENVAFNHTAEAANEALLKSPPHRANILSDRFNSVGIGVVRKGESLWVTEDFARQFEKLSEQQARDRVFAAFQQARRDAGGPPVKFVKELRLQAVVCRMAQTGDLSTRDALAIPGVHNVAAFTDGDLSKLPTSARKLAADFDISQIAVGACFSASAKYPSGMYWAVIAAY